MTRIQTLAKYRMLLQQATRDGHRLEMVRALAYNDLFYFLVFVLHREDANNDFVYARCREVQARPEGYLDAWAREHYKSTIITFAHNIWKAWHNPERTIAIIGRTSKVALPFLRQIKTELETNSVLWKIAPEVFWEDPQRYAPKWSEKDGLIVRRKGNPKEPTFSAFGMIDSLPVGPHFTDLNYDDAFEAESCRNPDALKLTYDRFRESLNLGTRGGNRRFLCTRWHFNDLAASCIKAGTFKPRIYPATVDGTETGKPYLLTREELAQKIRDYGPYIASCQLFMAPQQDSLIRFKEEWLRYWRAKMYGNLNLYILCDPASSKKKDSDYTVFICIGLGADRNYYIVNWIRDRLTLVERSNVLFKWHQQYQPVGVGYEKYGKDSDIEHYEDRMERDNYRFDIQPLGGPLAKVERINRLIPIFHQHRIYLPASTPYIQYDETTVDLTRIFVEDEYKAHPFTAHDDMLDCLARVLDDEIGATFPQGNEIDPLGIGEPSHDEEYDPLRYGVETR